MKVHIINYEQGKFNGILSKFALKMVEELQKNKYLTVTISNVPDSEADINHHINYLQYKQENWPKSINSLMITHIFDGYKREALQKGMETADIGICMSNDTKKQLIKWGFDKNKLTTVLPAHDGAPRRFQVVSITTNVYPDGCKRESMFTELVKTIDKNKFAFRIMGTGWHDILVPLVADGLQVDYYANFDYSTHQKILESSDYNLYFGEDEGSMGVLDAKNQGLKIIAPNVGFNKDVGVDYPFHTQEELNEMFNKLSINPVEDWTWKKYCDKHLSIWKKIKNSK